MHIFFYKAYTHQKYTFKFHKEKIQFLKYTEDVITGKAIDSILSIIEHLNIKMKAKLV